MSERGEVGEGTAFAAYRMGWAEGAEARWAPIETAPKDGRIIIARWDDEYAETVRWVDGHWMWSHDGESPGEGFQPTHWMPMYPPPTVEP